MAVKKSSLIKLTTTSLLAGIIILMAFTPVGYIKTAGLEITLLTIPVVVGAVTQGPAVGALLGGIFGVTSFIQAVSGMSAFGLSLVQINPVGSFITCVPTRLLMGLLAGLICRAIKKDYPAIVVASLSGPLLNTIMFMSSFIAFFWRTDFVQGFVTALGSRSVLGFVFAFVGVNGAVELIVCGIISTAVCVALRKARLTEKSAARDRS